MRPIRLIVEGFTSFRDRQAVDFSALERFVICGPTGAGKSSLLDALTFALFGCAPRSGGSVQELICQGAKGFSVTLDFQVGPDQRYRVTRSRRRSGQGINQLDRLSVNDTSFRLCEGASGVTSEVERLLGLKYEQFIQAVFLPQGQFATFLRSTASDRQKLLTDLLRIFVYRSMLQKSNVEVAKSAEQATQLRRRLTEDLADASDDACAALEEQLLKARNSIDESAAVLPDLRIRHEQSRADFEQTAELLKRLTAREKLEELRPAVEAARLELEASRAAARVISFLISADEASQAHTEAGQRASVLQAERETSLLAYESARIAVAAAESAAAQIPALRQRDEELLRAEGKVAILTGLRQRQGEESRRQAELTDTLAQATERQAVLKGNLDRLSEELVVAEAELAACGFDPERLAVLESQRNRAQGLQTRRDLLADLHDRKERVRAAVEQTQADNDSITILVADSRASCDTSRAKHASAEQLCRQAEKTHAALHLRAGLAAGDPCPVCCQTIDHLPDEAVTVDLPALKVAAEAARKELNRAEQAVAQAEAILAAAQSRLDERLAGLATATADLEQAETTLAAKTADLTVAVAIVVEPMADEPLDQTVLRALAAAVEARERRMVAEKLVADIGSRLALTQQTLLTGTENVARLTHELAVSTEDLGALSLELETVKAEIYELAGTETPKIERDRVQAEVRGLEAGLKAAQEADHRSNATVARATLAAEQAAANLNVAAERMRSTAQSSSAAIREAGFPDAAAVRQAERSAAQQTTLQKTVDEFAAASGAADLRIRELEESLGDRRISGEQHAQAEAELMSALGRHESARQQAVALEGQVGGLKLKLEKARQLTAELDKCDRRNGIYKRLASDLRADAFEGFLLRETVADLITDASINLSRLTGERFSLRYKGDIVVVDHDQADRVRGVATLSGGETFLASLSLALALSEHVQRLAGAVHLDCLFIDEGFGTLDPETLRVVSDAIRSLQVGGRMVGIITHVPELRDEFDQKLMVHRENCASRVCLTGV